MFEVDIVEKDSEEPVETMPARNRREAEIVERGANINLDRTRFYTRIREVDE